MQALRYPPRSTRWGARIWVTFRSIPFGGYSMLPQAKFCWFYLCILLLGYIMHHYFCWFSPQLSRLVILIYINSYMYIYIYLLQLDPPASHLFSWIMPHPLTADLSARLRGVWWAWCWLLLGRGIIQVILYVLLFHVFAIFINSHIFPVLLVRSVLFPVFRIKIGL